jgi:hypothetical protein
MKHCDEAMSLYYPICNRLQMLWLSTARINLHAYICSQVEGYNSQESHQVPPKRGHDLDAQVDFLPQTVATRTECLMSREFGRIHPRGLNRSVHACDCELATSR